MLKTGRYSIENKPKIIEEKEEQGYLYYLFSHLIHAITAKDVEIIYSVMDQARKQTISGKGSVTRYLFDKTDEQGKTLLHIAASTKNNTEILDALCQAAKKEKIIHYASRSDKSGATAGHYAINAGSLANFQILLHHGLNTHIQKISSGETVRDMINANYHNDKETHLNFMLSLVQSKKGQDYFSARHDGIKPKALKDKMLALSLKIDRISDCDRKPESHFKALAHCFRQLEKKDIFPNNIRLMISHINALEGPENTLYKAIDIALLFEEQDHFIIKSGLIKKIFSAMQSSLDEKPTQKEMRRSIEASFLLHLAKCSTHEIIKETSTRAAFGKYLKINEPSIAFQGLKQLNHHYIYQHEHKESQEQKCLYVTALVKNFLKIDLKQSECKINHAIKNLTPIPKHDSLDGCFLFFKRKLDSNLLQIQYMTEKLILSIYLIKTIIESFEDLIETDEIQAKVSQITCEQKRGEVLLETIKKTVTLEYLNTTCSEPVETKEYDHIMQKVSNLLSNKHLYNKIYLSFATTIKTRLSKLLTELEHIQPHPYDSDTKRTNTKPLVF